MEGQSDIKGRTFGLEIEMCDLDRSRVSLPEGYTWSKDEEIVNTDGTCNRLFGGEVNTPPLRLCQKDLHGLRDVYESMAKAGGRIKWSVYTHVHIYVGDLPVEKVKKVFLLFYVCYPFFRRYAKISECDELLPISLPIPERKYYDGVLNAETFGDIQRVFENNSKKGYIRHGVNISAYFKSRTIEFRMFHAAADFYGAMACVYSAYRIFYYATGHGLEDFKSLTTYDRFREATGLKYDTPDEIPPLIYQGNPYSNTESYLAKPLRCDSRRAAALYDAVRRNGQGEICVVNGFMFFYELFFFEKVRVSVVCQDAYCFLLHELANGKVSLTYGGKLGFLEDLNNRTPQRQLALALYAAKAQKFLMSESARNDAMVEALKAKVRESVESTEKSNERLFRLLTTCDFRAGTLQDALAAERVVFFNYGGEKTQKRAFKLISENSDLSLGFSVGRNEYYGLAESIPDGVCFYYFSESPYLTNLRKLGVINRAGGDRRSAGSFLYSNVPLSEGKASLSYATAKPEVNEAVPPDGLRIDNPDSLRIVRVSPDSLRCLQRRYVKKVEQTSRATFGFAVLYGGYTLGGFGFTLPKHKGYDLFQLADFCTNNRIPRLSKLILYCAQSEEVQSILSRSMRRLCETVISLAYTHKPVSMKYRGVYRKVDEQCTSSYLAYAGRLGVYATNKEIIDKYMKALANGNGRQMEIREGGH